MAIRLCSWLKGFYYVPRIDRTVIEQYKEDIIVLTGNLYGEADSYGKKAPSKIGCYQ